MSARRLEDLLSRLHADAPEPSPHRQALRAELVAAFRARHGAPQPGPSGGQRKRRLLRLGVGLAFAAALLAATQAPAEYPVEVGKRIELSPGEGGSLPPVLDLRPVLHRVGRTSQVEVHGLRTPDRGLVLTIDLWGDDVAGDVVERLRAEFPALREARITVTPLEATARGKLGALLGHKLALFGTDPAAIEAARRELQARLRAAGAEGNVDIQVHEDAGRRRVTVKVEATRRLDAGAEAAPPDGPGPAPLGELPGETEDELPPAPSR